MTRTNIETGMQRLYYVAWACLVIGGSIGGGIWVFEDHSHRLDDVVIWIGFVIGLPPALMFAVRWVYRGFMPKANA